MLIEAPIGNVFIKGQPKPQEELIDWLDLTWNECRRRAMQKQTRSGEHLRILLRRGITLRHGDILQDNPRIAVHLLPCEVLIARPRDSKEWATVGYELGNLHVPAQLTDDLLITIPDRPIEAIYERMGLTFEVQTRRFEPNLDMPFQVAIGEGFRITPAS